MSMLDKMFRLLNEKGIKQSELAKALGVKQQLISDWKSGKNKSYTKYASQIADILDVTSDYLLGRSDTDHRPAPTTPGSRWVPILGAVRAGVPTEAIQDFDADDLDNWEEIPARMARNGEYFCLRIKGDSMNPRIYEGDVVVVRKQEDAESGDIVVALVNGEDATVKKLKKRPDGIELIPFNPLYDIMFFSNAQIEKLPVAIIGVVEELRGKLK